MADEYTEAFRACAKERDELRAQVHQYTAKTDHLKRQAEIQAQEMRAMKTSLHECYQAVSGATGERGNWHGSRPVVECINELRAKLLEREPYVQHLETCDTWLFGSCDCGLDELLASHKEQNND